ncbi:MAG: ankyrin repeat domain-containing protein [Armatimonadetes bacterium]|nr:ankyrin repeat domain-containing protein [Armatimonadota bacterium]
MRPLLAILILLSLWPAYAQSDSGARDLYEAIRNGNLPRVQALLSRSPGLARVSVEGKTPLHEVARVSPKNSVEMARALLDAGADVNVRDDIMLWTPLFSACNSGNEPLVRLLLARGADVKVKTAFAETPLHVAQTVEVVKLLIKAGADINAVDEHGETPAASARQYRQPVYRYLKSSGGKE